MAEGRYTGPDDPARSDSEIETAKIEGLRDRLRLFAARRLGDWVAAEDVAQEAIRRALEALRAGRMENPAAVVSFLYQTVVNVCLHQSRSAGREARALSSYATSPRPNEDDPLTSLITAERRQRVRRALDQLEDDDRSLLSLTYVEALDTAEIGRRLNVTEGAVRVRRHRALKRLAEILGVTREENRGLKD